MEKSYKEDINLDAILTRQDKEGDARNRKANIIERWLEASNCSVSTSFLRCCCKRDSRAELQILLMTPLPPKIKCLSLLLWLSHSSAFIRFINLMLLCFDDVGDKWAILHELWRHNLCGLGGLVASCCSCLSRQRADLLIHPTAKLVVDRSVRS